MQLNVGSGPDYRERWVNVDACDVFRRDVSLMLPDDKLAKHFGKGTADEIFMRDMMEHFFRWEGVEVLKDFYEVLKVGGKVTIITPDLEKLVDCPMLSLKRKTELIRGAQGQSGIRPDNGLLATAWQRYPKLFSHPYTWTEEELREVMENIGFEWKNTAWQEGYSMVLMAVKK